MLAVLIGHFTCIFWPLPLVFCFKITYAHFGTLYQKWLTDKAMLWELFESPSLWFLYPWYILTQFSTSKPAGTRRSSLNRPEKPIRLCVQILKLRQWYGKSINKTLNNDHWVCSHCQVLTPPTKRTFFKCSQINPCPFLSTFSQCHSNPYKISNNSFCRINTSVNFFPKTSTDLNQI